MSLIIKVSPLLFGELSFVCYTAISEKYHSVIQPIIYLRSEKYQSVIQPISEKYQFVVGPISRRYQSVIQPASEKAVPD